MSREKKLLDKLNNGDRNGADELVRMYYPEILRYCYGRVGRKQAAEDCVQETFLKVFSHLDRYVHRGMFRAYVYRIAGNVCTDYWRKKRWGELDEEVPYCEKGFAVVDGECDFGLLLNQAPEEYREVVLLRFGQQLPLKEIGKILDMPMRTVQSRLRAALKVLKGKVEKEGWR